MQQPTAELIWIFAFVLLVLAVVREIRGSLLEPIADGPRLPLRRSPQRPGEDEEQPETDRAPSLLRQFPVLAGAVGMVFAVRLACLVVLHR